MSLIHTVAEKAFDLRARALVQYYPGEHSLRDHYFVIHPTTVDLMRKEADELERERARNAPFAVVQHRWPDLKPAAEDRMFGWPVETDKVIPEGEVELRIRVGRSW